MINQMRDVFANMRSKKSYDAISDVLGMISKVTRHASELH